MGMPSTVSPAQASAQWQALGAFAPHTKAVFEHALAASADAILGDIPACLDLPEPDPVDAAWDAALALPTTEDGSVTVRELYLRYVLTRAIVDQGSDIQGVEMWHSQVIERCYGASPPIAFLHSPSSFVERYPDVLAIAAEAARDVTAARAKDWADAAPGRTAGAYTPFNVNGMRGGKQAHWFTSARLFPAVLLSHALSGGLTDVVFRAGPPAERPLGMARRLRNDPVLGLGWCLGDKAADLFTKWAVGSLRLTPSRPRDWAPIDVAIPMDQRIGRLMMRTGLMDEFFGVPHLISDRVMFENRAAVPIPAAPAIPDGVFCLTVMEFRRRGRVPHGSPAAAWLNGAWRLYRTGPQPNWAPQEVVAILCQAASAALGRQLSPVHLDDLFMRVGGTWCIDPTPVCVGCVFERSCQANNDANRAPLKRYIT